MLVAHCNISTGCILLFYIRLIHPGVCPFSGVTGKLPYCFYERSNRARAIAFRYAGDNAEEGYVTQYASGRVADNKQPVVDAAALPIIRATFCTCSSPDSSPATSWSSTNGTRQLPL